MDKKKRRKVKRVKRKDSSQKKWYCAGAFFCVILFLGAVLFIGVYIGKQKQAEDARKESF